MSAKTGIAAAALAAALAVAGCGNAPPRGQAEEQTTAKRSDRLVDFSQKPPYVNGLEIDPEDSSFLLTTNRGFFRVSADGKKLEPVKATLTDPAGTSPIGTFLEISSAKPGEFVGSGHPDNAEALPPFLGFIRSVDGGRNWKVVSRLGEADLHQIRLAHDRLYAFDAVLGAILISTDGGEEWVERTTPRGLVLDFVVDPEDPNYLLTSSEDQIFRTTDQGKRFRAVEKSDSARLEWPAPGALMRADRDGTFSVSADRGQSWEVRGKVGGEPYRIKAVDTERVYVALSDGTIKETGDGGRTWKVKFQA